MIQILICDSALSSIHLSYSMTSIFRPLNFKLILETYFICFKYHVHFTYTLRLLNQTVNKSGTTKVPQRPLKLLHQNDLNIMSSLLQSHKNLEKHTSLQSTVKNQMKQGPIKFITWNKLKASKLRVLYTLRVPLILITQRFANSVICIGRQMSFEIFWNC